jgi:spore coat-associated protein N
MLNALIRRPRRLLATLALILAATGVAIGSGASFVSASVNPSNTFASGALTQSNSKAGAAILTAANMKPGDTKSGTVTITNTGTLGGAFSVTESAVDSKYTTTVLKLKVTDDTAGKDVYSGNLGGLGTKTLGTWTKNEAHTFTFTITFPETNTDQNADQNKTATADFTWNATQLAAKDLTNDAN